MTRKMVPTLMEGIDGEEVIRAPFVLHRVSTFPIIVFATELAQGGYAERWTLEMESLLAKRAPFVILIPSCERPESREDWARRVIWMKENKPGLSLYCKGVISIEPDRRLRADLERRVSGSKRMFGVSQHVVESEENAVDLARHLLSKRSVAAEALRILALKQIYEY
ncbi:hypothetical protein [Neorhizobium alkalisoli]|uniref:Uncharacterized protein n=1 Tax=Neorhizobium alkalisoli TaxID=528178 RepID=A0A561QB31_9HYPH|nr:hypothetical protein [Neorhizobium alkalisoli]TWF47551.1 hypothetical protein FHW37_11154 [Neorhizobium alkalisoli]